MNQLLSFLNPEVKQIGIQEGVTSLMALNIQLKWQNSGYNSLYTQMAYQSHLYYCNPQAQDHIVNPGKVRFSRYENQLPLRNINQNQPDEALNL